MRACLKIKIMVKEKGLGVQDVALVNLALRKVCEAGQCLCITQRYLHAYSRKSAFVIQGSRLSLRFALSAQGRCSET